MPQMGPINWLILFIIFSISFIIFNMLNFYCFNKSLFNNKDQPKTKTLNNSLNWKW